MCRRGVFFYESISKEMSSLYFGIVENVGNIYTKAKTRSCVAIHTDESAFSNKKNHYEIMVREGSQK
jgi:hypothetical protein